MLTIQLSRSFEMGFIRKMFDLDREESNELLGKIIIVFMIIVLMGSV